MNPPCSRRGRIISAKVGNGGSNTHRQLMAKHEGFIMGQAGYVTDMAEDQSGVDDIWDDWQESVNMTASELEKWLDTDESKAVGDKKGGTESVGHHSGRRIIDILGKKKAELTDSDVEWMHKVVGYVHRHRAQGPGSDVEHSRWRYSLMNWGNDPLKN